MNIQVKENKDKRSRICKMEYAFATDITMNSYPGNMVQVTGIFSEIRFTSAEFSEMEEVNGEPVQQDLSIAIRGDELSVKTLVSDLIGRYTIVKLTYTNGDVKIVGTLHSPLAFSLSTEGTPLVSKLTFSRLSAERAKYILPQ